MLAHFRKVQITLFVIGVLFVLTACETVKVPVASGGSKSDGIVEYSFQYGPFEEPKVAWDEVLIKAQNRCKAWGYKTGIPFGGLLSECAMTDGEGLCMSSIVTSAYQCVDNQQAVIDYLESQGEI